MTRDTPEMLDARTARLAALVVALAGGLAVFLVATRVFPYHSINHDEGVYLQQAAMLLDGRLFLSPPVPEAFRPWFFVTDPTGPRLWFQPPGDRLYPKYAPVPAALFAVGKLLGGYRLALAGVAAATLALCYGVVAEAFDRTRGLLAAVLLLVTPQFLVDAAVFLPYAPTTCLNLLFAFGYLRANRLADASPARARRYAALAGGAVGVAFFSRPYTAVLFAAPFVGHALWTLRAASGGLDRDAFGRQGVTAALGLVGVAVTLGYNWLVTGDPLLFPYLAFAPQDGIGFGYHRILGYGRVYTPELALRTTATALVAYASDWAVAGPLGVALAVGGLGAFLARARDGWDRLTVGPLLLAGVAVSVVVGNAFFWGTLNAFGDLSVQGDGLAAYLGPYYHYDLLVPTAAFAAHGAIVIARVTREAADRLPRVADPGRVAAAVLVVAAAGFGSVAVGAVADPIRENQAVTDDLSAAYAPFDGGEYTAGGSVPADETLVFLPTPYGDWLGHPFQSLRNDPGYERGTVYALREREFAVVDAFPDRRYYRYTYRGAWTPTDGDPVQPRVQRVRVVRGEAVDAHATFGVPPGVERVSIRLASEEGTTYYGATPDGNLSVTLHVTDGRARVDGSVQPVGPLSVPVDDTDDLLVTVFLDSGAGSGLSYRLELPTSREGGEVRALTPYLEVCRVPTRCGGEAAYVLGTHRPGVLMDVSLAGASGDDNP